MAKIPLMDGEQIVFQGYVEPVFRAWIAFAIIGLILTVAVPALGVVVLLFTGIGALNSLIKLKTSIFLITNKRVVVRVGVLTRRSLELNLGKVESVFVQSNLIDRMFNMGKLVVVGTGGTREAFSNLADPQVFKLKLQEQLDSFSRSSAPKTVT